MYGVFANFRIFRLKYGFECVDFGVFGFGLAICEGFGIFQGLDSLLDLALKVVLLE